MRFAPPLLLLVVLTAASAVEAEAPKVEGGEFPNQPRVRRPEQDHGTWFDFDKDGERAPFEDRSLGPELRIADLMQRMQQAEKIGQCWQRPMKQVDLARETDFLAKGAVGSYLGVNLAGPGLRNELQRIAVEDSRLGIPVVFGYDTIHGLITMFPIPLAQSCAWDPLLNERICAIAAAESKAVGIDWTFAPMVDVARDPRWGRIAEGSGEDPYLGGLLAAGSVRGFQGANPAHSDRIAACLKHYVGYGAAEGGRDYNATEIGLPTLRNIYLPPFKAGVDAGALSIMSAFNSLNGIPASGNRHLLTDVLRNEWKFTGMVVSDWDSILNMVRLGYAADAAEAAQLGITAGVDLEMVSHTYGDHLAALIARGDVSQAMLDEAVRRILRFKLRCGLFDKPYAKEVTQPFPRPESLALAREAAARSCVLVKNAGNILPLPTGKRIALIGPFAESRDLLGCWSRTGNLDQVVTLAEGLRTAMGAENLTVVRGCASTGQDTSGFSAAITAAKAADLVIMAVGESSELSGEAHSRQELDLPGNQEQLLAQISDTGTQIVVVLFTGRPLAIPDVVARSSAVLIAWHPGMQGGHGIADLLTGKSEPTGRLSASWPRTVGQIPVHYNRPPVGHGGGKPGSYLDELGQYKDGSPESLFAFGAGLGYANFSLTTPVLDRSHLTPGGAVTATATVRNTGKRRGQTVVQCYLRDHAARGGQRPLKELKGFTHITLDPGEERAVSFAFDPERLSYWLPNGQKVAEAGQFTIWISLDSQLGAGASLTLEKP